jgi:glycosyltransferase involved in cell wall biosynthesis
VTEPTSFSTEAATIARRLAVKLGCQTVALVGCARPPLITAFGSLAIAGYDAPEHVCYAAAVLPHETWRPLADAVGSIGELSSPLVVISARVLETLQDDELAGILGRTPAALVIDVDDQAGSGIRALHEQVKQLGDRGVLCVRAELIEPVVHASHGRSSPALIISDGHDPRAASLVETGFHSLRLDADVDTFSVSSRPARVCVVSYEVVGPCRNGGIGTANTSLALALARQGHEVTLLFTGGLSDPDSLARWRRSFSEQGVSYEELSADSLDAIGSPHLNVKRAWAAYERVRTLQERRPFDVIHGPECQGHLAYIALAKRHGIAFESSQIVTGVHSPTRWCYEANREPMDWLSAFMDEHLEQTGTSASDVVISPSAYMLSYLRSRGWRLPERTFVQQYTTSQAILDLLDSPSGDSSASDGPVSEIVFFGRLEMRKGIEVFCDALDELAEDPARDLAITFMGSAVTVRGEGSESYIARRAQRWPWTVQTMTGVSHADAVEYLGEPGRLAVMPSLVDNSPNTVYEAMALRVPMIVSRSGGTAELIALEDLERCSFGGRPGDDLLGPASLGASSSPVDGDSLSNTLSKALDRRFVAVRPAMDREANDACHMDWHAALAGTADVALPVTPSTALPRVSVILAVPQPDAIAGEWAASASTTGAEIVVAITAPTNGGTVDDRWNIVETGGVSPGRAMGLAAHAATGEVVLALPIDVIPERGAPAVLARAAAGSLAEIFVFPVYDAAEEADGGEPGRQATVVVPVGGPALLGLCYPYFGTAGFAIRADALRRLGGFNDAPSVAEACTNLLNRAALAGYRIDVMPAVIARRVHADPLRPLLRNDVSIEAMPWDVVPEEQIETLRPFRETQMMADLPALYRRSQQLLAELRAHHVRWEEVYNDLRAHAERIGSSHDALALSESRLRRRMADAERHRKWSDDRRAQLESVLDAIYNGPTWRITAPLRALRARQRST